jgi:hypothetical protein
MDRRSWNPTFGKVRQRWGTLHFSAHYNFFDIAENCA